MITSITELRHRALNLHNQVPSQWEPASWELDIELRKIIWQSMPIIRDSQNREILFDLPIYWVIPYRSFNMLPPAAKVDPTEKIQYAQCLTLVCQGKKTKRFYYIDDADNDPVYAKERQAK